MSFVYPFKALFEVVPFLAHLESSHSQGFGESLHEAVNAFAAEREVLNAEAVRLVFRCRWGRRNVSRTYHTHEPLLQKLPEDFEKSHLGQTSAFVSQNAPLEPCSVDLLLLDDVRLSHTTLQIFSANYYHGPPTLGSSVREISNFYPGRRIHYSSRLFANFSRQTNTYNVYN